MVVPSLETLILSASISPNDRFPDLGRLTLPALHRLQVAETLLRPDTIGTLQSLMSRSGCILQELYLTNSGIPGEIFRMLLPSVASISDGQLDLDDVLPGIWDSGNASGDSDSEADSEGDEEQSGESEGDEEPSGELGGGEEPSGESEGDEESSNELD